MTRFKSEIDDDTSARVTDNMRGPLVQDQAISSASSAPAGQMQNLGHTFTGSDIHMTNGYGESHGDSFNGDNLDDAVAGAYGTPESMISLGQSSRALIQVIQKLEALRIDATLPSLPKFVVVGDQSAGKSSIIEATCDISLPRSSGTCTRCPFRITTTANKNSSACSGWSCKITLERRYAYEVRQRPKAPYPHWMEMDQEPFVFARTQNRLELEAILRRAQLAILNPDKDPSSFTSDHDVPSDTVVGFSPNVIALDIEGPGIPELSFFDLPGAINVAEQDDEQYIVATVERLIKNYLTDEKALILLACAANQDIETSTAFKFVRQSRATERCMGVLTKPDLMDRSRVSNIVRTLNGELFAVAGSWFVTKQLSQAELDSPERISHADARERERVFFQGKPWVNELADFADRFGIPALQKALSDNLASHITNELPEIQDRVQQRLNKVRAQLADFPKAAQSPGVAVHTEIFALTNEISSQIKGGGAVKSFRSEYRKIFEAAVKATKNARPHLELQTPGFIETIDSDDEDNDSAQFNNTPTPGPAKRRRVGDDGREAQPTPTRGATGDGPKSRKFPPVTSAKSVKYKLDEMKADYQAGAISDLPNTVNPQVMERHALRALNGMPDLVNGLLGQIDAHCQDMLQQCVSSVLSKYQKTKLRSEADYVVKKFFSEKMSEQSEVIQHLVDAEMKKAITLQPREDEKRATHELLLSMRQTNRIFEYHDKLKSQGVKPSAIEKNPESKLGHDEYASMISQFALVYTYYNTATSRMIDNIAIILDYDVLQPMQTELPKRLIEQLRAHDEQYCAQLLTTDPQREQQRRRLEVESGKLEQALNELKGFPRRFTS